MKRSFYIFIAILTILNINSCQKSSEVVEPDVFLKNSDPLPELTLNLPDNICADEQFSASLNITGKIPGRLEILISENNGISWKSAASAADNRISENFYLALGHGDYKIKGIYRGFVDGRNLVISSGIYSRTAFECAACESIILEPELTDNNYLVDPGELTRFSVEITVMACDQQYFDLSLKGRLINLAVYKSSSPLIAGPVKKANNSLIQWNIGDVKAGFIHTYKVTFDYKIPPLPYGTMIPLTGGWILEGKRKDGSAVRIGDYNEIFVQIQQKIKENKEIKSYEI